MADDSQRIAWGTALRSNLEQLKSLHSIVGERLARQQVLDEALSSALERLGKERTDETTALNTLANASEDAIRRARLVAVKLEAAFLEAKVPEETYRAAQSAAFPRGVSSIGATPAQRVEALDRIVAALEEHKDADPSGELATLARDGAQAIRDANEGAKRDQAESREAGEQLARARHQWEEGYLATKDIVSGLLREADRLGELSQLFPDA